MISFIENQFDKFNISISESQAETLFEYYSFLVKKNNITNLTSITDFEDVVIKHFLDSSASLKFYKNLYCTNIIDVGTGAGFPGAVLAILCPESNITLLETAGKRVQFLQELITKLDLKNVNIFKGRAEDFGKNIEYRETFDYALSRAVAPLNILLEYLAPFVKVGGNILCYKGSAIEEELELSDTAIQTLGCGDVKIDVFDLPYDCGQRNFILLNKIAPTPTSYPRRAGVPSKRPLV